MTTLVTKAHGREGFDYVEEASLDEESRSMAKPFTDHRYKILIDNDAPYGHFMTNWLYSLLTKLEAFDDPKEVVVLFNKSPQDEGQHLYHMSSVTRYVHAKLVEKGYGVEYLDGHYFNITNVVEPLEVPGIKSQSVPAVVGPFLREGLTAPESNYGKKFYLSRGKTTTPNGNMYVDVREILDRTIPLEESIQKTRLENQYKFSDRMHGEAELESYLQTLGFEIITPEDFSSYQDQLNKVAEARILMSVTSASLHTGMVLQPGATIVELCTIMDIPTGSSEEFMMQNGFYHEHYRAMALAQKNPYIAIPNNSRKAEDIIAFIESNPHIKSLLES